MIIGGKYNWKGQPERLIYLGKNWSGNGYWHQFAEVGSPEKVWCEVLDDQLSSFEETPHDEADDVCDVPPIGWRCTRAKGHSGPCAAIEYSEEVASVARGMRRLKEAPNAEIQRASPASGEAPLE